MCLTNHFQHLKYFKVVQSHLASSAQVGVWFVNDSWFSW